MELDVLRGCLLGISAYRHLMDDPVIKEASSLLAAVVRRQGEEAVVCYTRLFYALCAAEKRGLGEWLHDALRYQESPYARLVERGGENPALVQAARRDIEVLAALADTDCQTLIGAMAGCLPPAFGPALAGLPQLERGAPFSFDSLTAFYQANGSGRFARYRAFLWEGGTLWPVEQPDCHAPEEMIGYRRQRDQVEANTRALLEGKAVNNVLLYGDSGTGKSAAVKSLLRLPGFEDLRLIEVRKEELGSLPTLIRSLAGRRRKFILFIDDLAFDQDDRTYSVLKTILEGGLERRPANVAIYATSNRRRLVRQTFSDRAGDEVDASETIQEKTSLSERFGLRIPYLAMSKGEYLDMVDALARRHGITLEAQDLRAQALAWEMRHPGRTPRTAQQFIASLRL